jgi:hypothetical protein
MRRLSASLLAILLAPIAIGAQAANIVISVADAPGVGFNDPTPATPVAGNPGTTLGAQRLNVFERAAEIWGGFLSSDVTIVVSAQFQNLTCSGTSAVLGSAGPQTILANFPNAPLANRWFVVALANARAGSDLNGAAQEINANFNAQIDSGTCLTGVAGWWYGLTPTVPNPDDRIPLLPVVLHELGHGLGFLSVANLSTGAFPTTGGGTPLPDVWAFLQYDLQIDKFWEDMNNAERVTSATNDPNLIWTGDEALTALELYQRRPARLTVDAPAAIAGNYDAIAGEFSGLAPLDGLTAPIVQAVPAQGCSALTNAGAIAGRIALIDRGGCPFRDKARNAQAAGAAGLLVANSFPIGDPNGGLLFMGPGDYTVTIPSYFITQETGNAIKAQLAGGVTATMRYRDEQAVVGSNAGVMRLHAPATLAPGSSVSHFTADAQPPMLMQPALSRNVFDRVDLTLALFRDIGWLTAPEPPPPGGGLIFRDGFEG